MAEIEKSTTVEELLLLDKKLSLLVREMTWQSSLASSLTAAGSGARQSLAAAGSGAEQSFADEASLAAAGSLAEQSFADAAQSFADEASLAEQSFADEASLAEQSLADEASLAEQSLAEQSWAEQSLAEQSLAEQSLAEQSLAEQSFADEASVAWQSVDLEAQCSRVASAAADLAAGPAGAGRPFVKQTIMKAIPTTKVARTSAPKSPAGPPPPPPKPRPTTRLSLQLVPPKASLKMPWRPKEPPPAHLLLNRPKNLEEQNVRNLAWLQRTGRGIGTAPRGSVAPKTPPLPAPQTPPKAHERARQQDMALAALRQQKIILKRRVELVCCSASQKVAKTLQHWGGGDTDIEQAILAEIEKGQEATASAPTKAKPWWRKKCRPRGTKQRAGMQCI